ncbi:NADP-dependent phosphogluconate dehydrogenase, partial [Candidatus Peregrinibacteria bacterium]|nr:NADP-dependent phosphogluconate dehydrogenase [Candidatus Peregrinibacteria bacterium]
KVAAENFQWEVNLAEVCRIWQGGCIIRSNLLIDLQKALNGKTLVNVLEDETIFQITLDGSWELQKLVMEAVRVGVSAPVAASGYNYFLGVRDAESPANLIQGLRDFFGAHTFERKDKQGIFHENWYE